MRRNFAFTDFESVNEARRALWALNKQPFSEKIAPPAKISFKGHPLTVDFAKLQRKSEQSELEERNKMQMKEIET